MKIPANLLTREDGKLAYIFTAYLLGFTISLSLGFLISNISPSEQPAQLNFGWADFVGLVLLAPIVETMMMVPIIGILKQVFSQTMLICIASALIWSILHGLLVPNQVITIFPLFFIFTLAYMVWNEVSRQCACLVVISIHMLNNLTAFAIGLL